MVHKLSLIIIRWYKVTATCYGLDGPGIESRWGRRFCTPVQTGVYNKYHVCSPSVNRPGCDADCSTTTWCRGYRKSTAIHCSPSGPVLGRTLPFTRSQTDVQLRLYFLHNVYNLHLMKVFYETYKHVMCLQNAEVF